LRTSISVALNDVKIRTIWKYDRLAKYIVRNTWILDKPYWNGTHMRNLLFWKDSHFQQLKIVSAKSQSTAKSWRAISSFARLLREYDDRSVLPLNYINIYFEFITHDKLFLNVFSLSRPKSRFISLFPGDLPFEDQPQWQSRV